MWSKAGFGLFVRFAALYFLVTCGIGQALTVLGTEFFDYSGVYTPELVTTCLLVSLTGAWLTLRRLKGRILRGDDVIGPMKQIEAHPYAGAVNIRNRVIKLLNKLRSRR